MRMRRSDFAKEQEEVKKKRKGEKEGEKRRLSEIVEEDMKRTRAEEEAHDSNLSSTVIYPRGSGIEGCAFLDAGSSLDADFPICHG